MLDNEQSLLRLLRQQLEAYPRLSTQSNVHAGEQLSCGEHSLTAGPTPASAFDMTNVLGRAEYGRRAFRRQSEHAAAHSYHQWSSGLIDAAFQGQPVVLTPPEPTHQQSTHWLLVPRRTAAQPGRHIH